MSNQNLGSRFMNLIRGFIGIFISEQEQKNPEIAYQNAVDATTKKHLQLRAAAGRVLARHNDIKDRLEAKQKELQTVELQLQAALDQNNEQLGGILIQKKDALERNITELNGDLVQAKKDVDETKNALTELQANINSLKSEKDSMIARLRSAEARQQINDMMDGLTNVPELQALDNVRTSIKGRIAEAQISDELRGTDVDRQLKELTRSANATSASSRFKEMQAARKKAAEASSEDRAI